MEFKTSSQESHTLQLSSSSTATTTTTSSSPQQSSMVRGVTIDLEKAIETLFNRWICSGGGVKIISGSDIESPRTFIEKEIRELDPASATLFGNLVQQYTNRNKILDRSDSSFTEIIASNTAWKEDQKNQQQQGLETQAAAGGGTETSAADDAVSTNPSTTTTSVLPTTTSSNNILPLEVSGEKDNFSIKSQDDVEINKVEVEGGDDGNLMVGVTKTSTTTTASPSPPPSAVLTLQLLENVTDDEKSLADSIQMISEPRVVDSVMEDGQGERIVLII